MSEGPQDVCIFDIDGVLACNQARLDRLRAGQDSPEWMPDWEAFYADAPNDPPLEGWCTLLRTLWGDRYPIVLLTNRPERFRSMTEEWLAKHNLRYDELRMRDGLHYNHSKVAHLDEMAEAGYTFRLAVDDDPLHGEMYITRGIPFLYAHSGYYDNGRIDDSKLSSG